MMGTLTRIPRSASGPARHAVYTAVRDAIVSVQLEPGRRLSENELAAELGVSRTPVREALVRLRDDRLVEVIPQLGTFVTRISVSAVNNAQFVREALESAAVRLAAERAGTEGLAALEDLLAGQELARDRQDADRFLVLDEELHAELCALSGHDIAWAIAGRANGHLARVRRLSLAHPSYLAEMVAEHRAVVEAVRRAQPDAAERALRHHLRMVLSDLPAICLAHPSYFDED